MEKVEITETGGVVTGITLTTSEALKTLKEKEEAIKKATYDTLINEMLNYSKVDTVADTEPKKATRRDDKPFPKLVSVYSSNEAILEPSVETTSAETPQEPPKYYSAETLSVEAASESPSEDYNEKYVPVYLGSPLSRDTTGEVSVDAHTLSESIVNMLGRYFIINSNTKNTLKKEIYFTILKSRL